MPKTIAIALITQEQMNIDTAFDFICMAGSSTSKDQSILIISPQRADKEIAKREAVEVAAKQGCESILFIRDDERFIPETLNGLLAARKEVIGCKTKRNGDIMGADLALVHMEVFNKIEKPYFASMYKKDSLGVTPDYFHFFQNCEKVGVKIYSEDKLTEANNRIEQVKSDYVVLNARKIKGGNPGGKSIAIAVPSDNKFYTHTCVDVAQLVSTNIGLVKDFVIINVQSDEIGQARNMSVHVAKSEKADCILFIDSDMRFPRTSLMKLLSRKKQIIGVNATKRDGSNKPIFFKNLFGKAFNYKKGDKEQVHFIGMGVTLIDMAVFDKLEMPYFYPNYEPGTDNWRAEDYAFCWEARQKGFSIWCDVGLSKEIGHIGAQAYYLK